MPESFDKDEKIRAAKLRGDVEYLSNAGRRGAEKANETKRFNKMMAEIDEEERVATEKQRFADMAKVADERRDDLLNE